MTKRRLQYGQVLYDPDGVYDKDGRWLRGYYYFEEGGTSLRYIYWKKEYQASPMHQIVEEIEGS